MEIPGLPGPFAAWFAGRGWTPHPHQLALLDAARAGRSTLLIAPTGGGKTLAGFLPSLVALATAPDRQPGLDTLYISPLKALAVDIHRNLEQPIAEMGLPVTAETRTGDTPQAKRVRQRKNPPHLLLTTPESLALMLSYADAPEMFARLRTVVVDEVHAIAGNKRGDLLALGLARLKHLAPDCRVSGLSATVAFPEHLAQWLGSGGRPVEIIQGAGAKDAEISILRTSERMPWGGRMALFSIPDVYQAIKGAGTTLVFVNTRAQAE
ncbi:MAG: DEAD/DEAH box helicase, partial [Rhodospirillales bacterium]|nr:DEAD/DEAH box helicase [Rhodospirillales bacterium]